MLDALVSDKIETTTTTTATTTTTTTTELGSRFGFARDSVHGTFNAHLMSK
jgi:hypothetical protein